MTCIWLAINLKQLYADDTTLVSTVSAFKQNAGAPDCKLLSDNINYELTRINEWLALNKLNLNINKTKYIIFHFSQRNMAFLDLELKLCGQHIECVRQFVFLGITIHETLNWDRYIDKIANKISRTLGVMNKLKHFLPKYTLKIMYSSLIAPHFNNNILLWGFNTHTPIMMSRINICGQLVDTSAVIRDLGFVMDDHLSMASQVSNICRSAYYHLSRIAKIRHSLTTSVCKSLIHGLVTSRLDYGNAMLFGIADRLLHRLEMVQRSAARVVMQIRRGDRQSMTTILQRLHWLPVKKRIEFKILVLVHKAIYEGQPVYLASLLNQHTPKRCLRSSSGLLLDVPRVNLERFGRRAFACAGPTLWNNLPISLRVNGNHTQFKKLLKTYLFST